MDKLVKDQRDIAHWIATQTGPLRIAVAFWGQGALEELGLRRFRGRIRVLLDLSSGASNPVEVKALMRAFPDCVQVLDRLHAKAWIATHQILIGSANASANGLGFEGNESRQWCELGLTSSDPSAVAQAQEWFDQQWSRSRPITAEDLVIACDRWKIRRATRPPSMRPQGKLLDAVAANPEEFRDKRIFVVVVSEELSTRGEQELEAANERAGTEQYAFEQWRGIPLNATLISFSDYGDGLKLDTPPVYSTAAEVMTGRLQIVFPKRDVLGYKVGPFSQWKPRLQFFAKNAPTKWKNGDMCMELIKFVEATNE